MRLTEEQAKVIREVAWQVFGAEAIVRLFGSRIDDTMRGGDIDLLVECPAPVEGKVEKACRMSAKIQMKLGEQKIDILILDPATVRQPIHEIAMQTGIRL